jgi:hypothetical protein
MFMAIGVLLAVCRMGQAQQFQDRNPRGWVSGGDPVGIPGEEGEILDPRFYPLSGWFANVEVGVMGPHLANQVNGDVPIAGRVDHVQLPTAPLDWTASPRVGLGYRFANAGELLLSYQSLVSEGSSAISNNTGLAGSLRSRLNLNVATFDWVSLENSFGPDWGMKWHAGAAYSSGYFDTQATSPALAQKTTDLFNAGGIHAGLDLWRALPAPGLSVFGRLDGMFMVGPVNQSVSETINPFGTAATAGLTQNQYIPAVNTFTNTATPIVLILEGGVSYTPPNLGRWLRLTAAYHFERWWAVGMPLSSDGELILNGVIFRAEISW